MPSLSYISPDLIKSYQDQIAKSASPATVKRKSISLNRFFVWAKSEGHVDENPFDQTKSQPFVTNTKNKGKIKTRTWATICLTIGLVILIFLLAWKLKVPIPFIKNFAQGLNNQTAQNVQTIPQNPNQIPANSATIAAWNLYAKLQLTDTNGVPQVGSQTINFKLYNQPIGGNALYTSPSQTVTTDSSGSVLISLDQVPSNLFFQNNTLYLEPEIVSSPAGSSSKPFRIPISTANTPANLGGYFPANPDTGATAGTVPVIDSTGALQLASQSAAVKAKQGNLLVEGQAVTIKSSDGGSGNIEINPDANGYAHFLFEGNKSNFLNAEAPNLTTGSLYYGMVPNNATGYDLIKLQSGAPTMTTRFSVDASGNVYASGNAILNGQLQLGRFSSLPGAIGQGSLVFNTSNNKVYVWDGTNWVPVGNGGGGGSSAFDAITSATNTSATMVVGSGASLNFTGTGTINASNITCVGCVNNTKLANSAITINSSGILTGGGTVALGGTLNLIATEADTLNSVTGRGATTTNAITVGNLTSTGTTTFGGIAYTWPGTQPSNYILSTDGSGTLSWADPNTVTAGTNYWNLASGALFPKNNTVDLLIGGSATTSAKFAFTGVNGGLPTASISGTTAATFIDGNGNISTTNGNNLTLGNSSTYNTTGNILLNPNGTGNVGIGTANPPWMLSLNQTDAAGTVDNYRAANFVLSRTVDDSGGVKNTVGLNVYSNYSGTGTYYAPKAIQAVVGNLSTGTITEASGLKGTARNDSTGTITTARGLYAIIGNYGAGTIDDAQGVFIGSAWNHNGGTITNNYGLYIENQESGTNNYSIFSAGSKSYFAGAIGIGTATPSATLDVAGNASVSGTLAFHSGTGTIQTTNFSPLVIGGDTTGNILLSPSNDIAGGYIGPNITDVTDLGTSSLLYRNIYGTTLYQGTYQVCDSSGSIAGCGSGTGTNYWALGNGTIYPGNLTQDLLIGDSATTSAKFAFINVLAGTPTASISGSTAGVATYLTGDGTLATTNGANLTLGGNTTGNITLNPSNGTGTITLTGYGTGIIHSTSGVLSSSAVDLAGSDVTGLLSLSNGGTNTDLSGVSTGGLIYKGASALAGTSALSGLLYGNDSSGPATVTGLTANYLPKYSTSPFLANSLIYDTGTQVGIGTTSPTALFDVAGNASLSGTLAFHLGTGTIQSTNFSPLVIGGSTTGNITLNPSNAITGGNVSPNTTGVTDLGTSSLLYGNIYGTTLYQGTYQVCDSSGSVSGCSGTNYWEQASGAIYPFNNSVDLLLGASATSSAKFAFKNILKGTPTASISGTAPVALFIDGNGNFSTTNKANLTIGNSSTYATTGNILLNPSSGNVGIGTTSPIGKFQISDGNSVSSSLVTTDYGIITAQNTAPGFSIISADNTTAGDRAVFKGVRSRGTLSSPAVPLSGDEVLSFLGAIYDGSATVGTAMVDFVVDGSVSSGVAPQRIGFFTSATNAAGRTERLTIKSGGDVGIGTPSPGYLLTVNSSTPGCNGCTLWTSYSDSRLKENVVGLSGDVLSKIMQLNPVSFNYNDTYYSQTGYTRPDGTTPTYTGFIAQDLQQIFPEMVNTASSGYLDTNLSNLQIYLVKGIQQQQREIASMSGQLANLTLTDTGGLNIAKATNGNYQLTNSASGGSVIDKIGAFANVVAANVKSGAVTTTDFVAQNVNAGAVIAKNITTNSFTAFRGTIDNLLIKSGLVTPNMQVALISPLPGNSDVTVQIGTASESGQFAIQNVSGNAVATIDNTGNATFSGQVTSNNLQVTNGATVSGTLYADDIKSRSLDDIQNLLTQVQSDQNLLTQAASWNVNTATNSANLNSLAVSDLYITNQAAINSLSVTNSLTVGTDLVISPTDNSLNSLSAPLKIQSLAMAPVEIMDGLVTIDTKGNVNIAGDLFVAGRINSAGLTLKDNRQTASPSAALLSLQNSNGDVVSSVDASGSAAFNSLSTQGLTIAGSNVASASSVINGAITTNSTVGSAVIPAGTSEITIKDPKVTDYTLVYVTPTSPTNNYVLYVKSKQNGQFTVGFTSPIGIDADFNWWIVQVQ